MSSKNTSPIRMLSPDQLATLVAQSRTYKDILSSLGLRNAGSSHRVLKERIKSLNIPTSHLGNKWDGIVRHGRESTIPIESILVEYSTYNRVHLKSRLISSGILQNKCSQCGLDTLWHGRPISLELHHINGRYRDNRVENLTLLCPNCHSQQKTSSGKNKRYKDIQ